MEDAKHASLNPDKRVPRRRFKASQPIGTWPEGLMYWLGGLLALVAVVQSPLGLTEEAFLKVDEAFKLSIVSEPENHAGYGLDKEKAGSVSLKWEIAEGYYLYLDRIKVRLHSAARVADDVRLGKYQLRTEAKTKQDPYFGEQQVLLHHALISVPYTLSGGAKPDVLSFDVEYQGCAEAGLCYPPRRRLLEVKLPDSGITPENKNTTVSDVLQQSEDADAISQLLQQRNLLLIAGVFFLFGLGLTFTPCVFPMIPILSSIIVGSVSAAGSSQFRRLHGLSLSFMYVMGMSFTYTALGLAMGYLGAEANLQAWLQQPVVLTVFAGVFVLLALSMFGFYELQLPSAIRDRLDRASNRLPGGQYLGVAGMGALSALVVSPCVSAPLAGAMIYISASGDALLGAMALFALAWGMGVPLLFVGLAGGKVLPKSGAWMDRIKQFFGVVLLGVAIWLTQRVIPESVYLMLWASLLIGVGVHLGALSAVDPGKARAVKSLGLIVLIWGVLQVLSAASGRGDFWRPLAFLTTRVTAPASVSPSAGMQSSAISTTITSKSQMEALLKTGEPLIFDVYAQWCVSCKEMEDEIFKRPGFRHDISPYRMVTIDITEFSPEQKQLLAELAIVGPPAILLFDRSGHEIREARMVGDVSRSHFMAKINHTKPYVSGGKME
ncbi:MAG: protein-disulfide reductase DsbD [Pseudomonadales bacterium]|nr:protein-disulfide reductase DsbD [Pseudomonadales bacterium]